MHAITAKLISRGRVQDEMTVPVDPELREIDRIELPLGRWAGRNCAVVIEFDPPLLTRQAVRDLDVQFVDEPEGDG